MKRAAIFAAVATFLAVPAPAAPAHRAAAPARYAAPAARDWTRVVVATREGGFRMGNPAARVKLVEYASLSCPFCARFDREGAPALRDKYVKSGQVSWEYRTYLNHPTDPAVSVLVHCQGAQSFFPVADQLYAAQERWYGRFAAAPRAQLENLQHMAVTRRNAEIIRLTGLDDFFRRHGMSSSRIQSCLADGAMLDRLAAIVDLGNRDGIDGTPNFLIHGRLVTGASDWTKLEPMLRAAIG
jgi:protein-disulfide isomerase